MLTPAWYAGTGSCASTMPRRREKFAARGKRALPTRHLHPPCGRRVAGRAAMPGGGAESGGRQGEAKVTAGGRFRAGGLEPEVAAHLLHEVRADVEAQAEAREVALLGARGAIEILEEAIAVLGCDANAIVAHRDEWRAAVCLGDRDRDGVARRGVVCGVVNEVAQHLLDARGS